MDEVRVTIRTELRSKSISDPSSGYGFQTELMYIHINVPSSWMAFALGDVRFVPIADIWSRRKRTS